MLLFLRKINLSLIMVAMKNNISYACKKQVLKYIEKNQLIKGGETVIVGLSGGADSVCLLSVLKEISEELDFSLYAIHVHHGIRRETADRDEAFSRKLCGDMKIPYKAEYIDVPKEAAGSGESYEECARRLRYGIFSKEAKGFEKPLIAVAHHKDDQAETVLFRMIRGTGIKGLAAMLPKNGNIIRPLLCLSKSDILSFLLDNQMSYVSDETNEDPSYSRNRIRLNILPEAEKICDGATEHIADICEDAKRASDFIEKCAGELVARAELKGKNENIRLFKVDMLRESEEILINTALRQVIEGMIHSLKDVTREHIESIKGLLNGYEARSIDLPKGLKVRREGNELEFTVGDVLKTEEKKPFFVEINSDGSVILPKGQELTISFDDAVKIGDIPQNLYTKWLDYDKISPGLCLRQRQEGDYLIIDGKGSKKSLKKYMVDEKIPKSRRDTIPVLARGHEIFWVLGYRISESCKVDEKTEHIIRFEIKGDR